MADWFNSMYGSSKVTTKKIAPAQIASTPILPAQIAPAPIVPAIITTAPALIVPTVKPVLVAPPPKFVLPAPTPAKLVVKVSPSQIFTTPNTPLKTVMYTAISPSGDMCQNFLVVYGKKLPDPKMFKFNVPMYPGECDTNYWSNLQKTLFANGGVYDLFRKQPTTTTFMLI